MAVQNVVNAPLGQYPVLVDKNSALSEMQVVRIDAGTGSAESRVSATNGLPVSLVSGLAIPASDYISLSYTSGDLTGVVYKTGGSGGTTVATLTLAYTSGNLTSVTKT